MLDLSIHLVQADLVWQNENANLEKIGNMISGIEGDGVIVLPEMFATGFTMEPEKYATDEAGIALKWMKENSKGRAVCGSLSVKENDNYFNRFYWVENGEIKHRYDKKHLFGYGAETSHYTAGDNKIIIEYLGWKILPFVCYDLRFPVWCRNTEFAHLMLYVANWPKVRIQAWERLLQARAIENQCYVAGANRVGTDGNGMEHNGNSMICDPRGDILLKNTEEERVLTIHLNAKKLLDFREQFPVLKDADPYQLL